MLNTINDLIKKKGLEYVKNLLSEDLIITEKLDTYRILVEKKDNEIKFYKKDNTEINLIERVLTNLWEDAIIELSIILNEKELPENYRFGIAYSPVIKPLRLKYEKIPKYILTDVVIKENNKVKDILNLTEVTQWSKQLSLGRPPVIFEGKLNEETINKLFNYSNNEIQDKLQDIIGYSYSNEDLIEGIIINSKNKLIQIPTYEFKILNENYNKKEKSRDFYDITMISISNFIEQYKLPILENINNSDEAYLEIISNMFNEYINSNKIDEKLNHEFLEPPTFGYLGDLNLLLLKNKETISILEKGNKVHESIFRIMLSSFRKYKTKLSNLLNESHLEKLNIFTYLLNINLKNNLGPVPNLEKKSNKLLESKSENIVIKTYNKKIKTDDLTTMSIISSIQSAFNTKAPTIKKGKTKCVVYLIDANPVTSDHINNINQIAETFNLPIIIGTFLTDNKLNGKGFHLSDELKKVQLQSILTTYSNKVSNIFFLEEWNLKDIFEYTRPEYEPVSIISEEGTKSELVLQLYFEEEIMGKRLGIDKNFNIGEMPNSIHNLVLRSIEDNNATNFKELTPMIIWNFYDTIIAEYKEWAGIVPKQFELNKF